MKKLFILSSVAALGAISAMGQGQVNLNDGGSTGVFLKIMDTRAVNPINGGAAAVVGTPATAAGFTGAGPGQVAITVWGAPQGTAIATAEATTPLFSGFNSASALAGAQGTFNAGGAYNLTTANVSGWNGSGPLEFIFLETVTAAGVSFSGFAEAQNITAATGIATPTPVFGNGAGQIGSLVMTPPVPEPTTIALGGLGAAALLLFRRRK